MTQIISSFAEISDRYDAVFCDLWGCIHNGRTAYPAAIKALEDFASKGGHVLLLTNAPRPSSSVHQQLDLLGVPRSLQKMVVSSGDAAIESIHAGRWGKKVYHIGAPEDNGLFKESGLERVELKEAESIVCTGLYDDLTETPEDYRKLLNECRLRGLTMLNANPDITVHRGETLCYCAGALAALYAELGGKVQTFGKPHPPIYDLARRKLTELAGRVIDDNRIICIGDGILTDIQGAVSENLDSLFVSGGLAADKMGDDVENPKADLLEQFFKNNRLDATATIGRLR